MKRILSLLIALLIVLASASALFACSTPDEGGKDKGDGATGGSDSQGGSDADGDDEGR